MLSSFSAPKNGIKLHYLGTKISGVSSNSNLRVDFTLRLADYVVGLFKLLERADYLNDTETEPGN